MMKLLLPEKKQSSEIIQLPRNNRVIEGFESSWIARAVREHYRDTRPIWDEPRPLEKGWSPSLVGEPNDRILVAGYLGYRGDLISDKLARIFDMGNDIEQRWITRFKDMGVWEGDDIWLPNPSRTELLVRGKVDILIHHIRDTNRKFVVEVKSMNPHSFNSLPKPSMDAEANWSNLRRLRNYVGDRMRRYLCQLQVYIYEMNMTEGYLLVDNKGNQDFSDFLIRLHEDVVEEMYERMTRLQRDFWSQGLIPPWNGVPNRSVLATYKPDEAVPFEEMRLIVEGSS